MKFLTSTLIFEANFWFPFIGSILTGIYSVFEKNLGKFLRVVVHASNTNHFPAISINIHEHFCNEYKPHASRYISSPRMTRDPPTETEPSVEGFIVDRDNRLDHSFWRLK